MAYHDVKVNYYGQRILGPESVVEDAIASRIPCLFSNGKNSLWAGASLPIGAGKPDLLVVAFEPKIFVLGSSYHSNTQILAYLRAVGNAKARTIALRVGKPEKNIIESLDGLVKSEIIKLTSGIYSISQEWRDILPEITSIEAKVSNWKKAIEQASRNRIFAHRSFVALPSHLALKLRSEPHLKELGIGLLAVSETGDVSIVKRARFRKPRVWYYYYQIAELIAKQETETYNAV